MKVTLRRTTDDTVVLKMANGEAFPHNDFDPSDDVMFLPMHVEGYRDGMEVTLAFISEDWSWGGDARNYACEWQLDPNWPKAFKRKVVIALREWIREIFEEEKVVFK